MSRKDVFANLKTQQEEADQALSGRTGRSRMRPILGSPDLIDDAAPSPVGAIGQSLNEVNERNKRAEEIERRLSSGQAVVMLDTSDIDPSFVQDRMPGAEDAHEDLVASIRDQGQQVPILVRPHPQEPGRYQVAFGHRRLRAIAELGLQVSAIVRDLTDEQLVVAQGQENSQRQDLTYIEKARYAERLTQRFPRSVIMAAMSIYKSDLSKMLSVVSRIPAQVIDLIGPAPGVGRRSWIELSDLLERNDAFDKAQSHLEAAEIRALPSEERFKSLVAHLKPRAASGTAEVWSNASGKRLVKVTTSDAKIELVIDRREAPEVAEFVLKELQGLLLQASAKRPGR